MAGGVKTQAPDVSCGWLGQEVADQGLGVLEAGEIKGGLLKTKRVNPRIKGNQDRATP